MILLAPAVWEVGCKRGDISLGRGLVDSNGSEPIGCSFAALSAWLATECLSEEPQASLGTCPLKECPLISGKSLVLRLCSNFMPCWSCIKIGFVRVCPESPFRPDMSLAVLFPERLLMLLPCMSGPIASASSNSTLLFGVPDPSSLVWAMASAGQSLLPGLYDEALCEGRAGSIELEELLVGFPRADTDGEVILEVAVPVAMLSTVFFSAGFECKERTSLLDGICC